MRDSTIIYRSFYEAIKELPKINQAEVWNAIFEYSLNFREVELKGLSKTIFTLIKPQLEANIAKFKNGSKPKRVKSETEANNKQNESKTEGNVNVNDNVNVNENNNVNLNANSRFSKTLLESHSWVEAICRQNKITESEVTKWIDRFNLKLDAELDIKVNKTDYASHFTRWVGTEIKNGKINTSGQAPVFSNR